MDRIIKTGFFDYYRRALREGLTESEAYRWAITEDMYDAEDVLITAEEATADGMCYHPRFAVEGEDRYRFCGICGLRLQGIFVRDKMKRPLRDGHWIWKGPPVKIPTRREVVCLLFAHATLPGQVPG